MDDAVFTSQVVTDAIAARAVREVGKTAAEPLSAMHDALEPISDRIYFRGKLTRTELRPVFNELVNRLKAKENVSDLHSGVMSNSRVQRLSAKESCRLRFIQTVDATVTRGASGELIEKVLAFAAQDVQLSRHALRVQANMTGFYLHPHALSRYMQRMQKPYRDLLQDIMRPMYVSAILGNAIGNGGILLPVHGGILLGRVAVVTTTETWPKVTVFDKNGTLEPGDDEDQEDQAETKDEPPREQIVTNVSIKTFIDSDSLGNLKAALRAQIATWEEAHAEGIRRFFDHLAYCSTLIAHDEDPELTSQSAQNAFEAALELIDSEAWKLVFP